VSPAAYSEGLGSKDTGSKIRSVTSKNRMVKPFVPEYPQLSAEQELILCCARTHVEPSQVARVGSLLDSELDWQRLLSYGSRHGVLPLVYENLKRLAPEKVPEVWLLSLERSFKARILCNLRMVTELFEVLKSLEREGIKALPHKGPVLAVLAYKRLSLREFVDLDLVVDQREIPRVYERMTAIGYQSAYPWNNREWIRHIPGQYRFTKHHRKVEVHTPQTMRYFPRPLDLSAILSRVRAISLAGHELPCIAAEDLLPMLCVHGSTHLWDSLKWICDIAELIRNAVTLDWEMTAARARELACERMLFLGLYLAKELFQTALPEAISQAISEDRAVERMSRRIFPLLFESLSPPGLLERCHFRFRMSGGALRGARYCWRMAFSPTEDDWAGSRLPPSISSILRPLRLASKYGWA